MNQEFIGALKEIVKDKGISEDLLFTTIEDALVAAYKKNYAGPTSSAQNVKVTIDRETGEIHVYSQKIVVEEVFDDVTEIGLEEAQAIRPIYDLDDVVDFEVTPKNFGRVAAQLAKQMVIQRIKESERNVIYSEFAEKEFDILPGTVIRKDKGNVFVDLGKIEGVLGPNEQMPTEKYNFNEKLQLYVVEVKKTSKGASVLCSRTHPGLVKRLFELEVPEIYEGIVEIKSIAREAGSRTKIAVYSNDESVDAMGACVGPKGVRVQNIVNELKNEKIDIIKWSNTPSEYIENALSPAKVISVEADEETKSAKVIVDDSQLSLAIGKEGQNVRLAAKLTGWKIDIKSKSKAEELLQEEDIVVEEDTILLDFGGDKMKPKKIPMRMCNGCMEMKPKKELIRIVKNAEGEVSVDLTGKKSGRGAYICKSVECLEKAFKAKRLNKNLQSNIGDEVYDRLRDEITNG